MKRREFFKISSIGLTLPVTNIFGSSITESKKGLNLDESMLEITISDLQKKIKNNQINAKDITRYYLNRIKEIDKAGPKLNAILELNPDAMKIAENLDRIYAKSGSVGPLHGIPILIKGNIDTKDKMTTTAGSLALEGSIATEDAFIVSQLRKAGAVILGKTNLSEWANFRSTRSSSGWSSQGGQTRNPYILDRSPCGSSSGSGVAVAANLCAVAIGTETDGSVVCPSNANGIVGIKPTIGLVSRSGIIPISHSQDTAGAMARIVSDAAILLSFMTGFDLSDPVTKILKNKNFVDYTKFLNINGLDGKRIGVARDYFGFHERVDELMVKVISTLKKSGAHMVDPANIETKGKFGDEEYEVLLYEFKADINKYLKNSSSKTGVKSLSDLIAYNEKHKEKMMPYFGQEILLMANKKGPLTDKKYLKALGKCKKLSGEKGIDALMKKHKLDAIIAPTGGPAWKIDLINGDHFGGDSSSMAAVAGYPSITVPMGFIHELPVGVSFFGKAFSEPALISIAYAYEQASKHRKPPKYKRIL